MNQVATISMSGESNQAKDIKMAYMAIRDARTPIRSVNDIVTALNGKGSSSLRRNIYHLLNSNDKIIARSIVNGEVRFTVAKPLGERVHIPKRVTEIKRGRKHKVVMKSSFTHPDSKQGKLYNIIHLVVSTLGPYEDSSKLIIDCEREYQQMFKEPLPREGTFSGALTTMIIATNGTVTGERETERSRWRNIRMRNADRNIELPEALTFPVGSDRLGTPPRQESLPLEPPTTPPAPIKPPPPPPPGQTLEFLPVNKMTMEELEAWAGALSIGTAKALKRIITGLLED